jgi:hypothetical protein
MKSRFLRLAVMLLVFHLAANAALAFSIGPFSFGFFNSTLTNWFLLPFGLGGCA